MSDCRVEFRPRRQLVVRLADDSDELVLRFLHFYPSHQKTLRGRHAGCACAASCAAASSGGRWCTRRYKAVVGDDAAGQRR